MLLLMILAKTRLQSSQKSGVDMFQFWREALQNDGIQGLFQGWQTQVAKVCENFLIQASIDGCPQGFLNQGLTMMMKER